MHPPAVPSAQLPANFQPPHHLVPHPANSGVLPPPPGLAPRLTYQDSQRMELGDDYTPLGEPNLSLLNQFAGVPNSHQIEDYVPQFNDTNNVARDTRIAIGTENLDSNQEIDHESLQEIFHLPDAQLGQARQILEMNTRSICAAFVYGIFHLISLLVGRARDEQINPVAQVAPATARPVADVRNFMYTDYIKDDIRDFIRGRILDSRLTSYSRQNDADGAAQPLALINLNQAHIASLPDHIKDQHLPVGFARGDAHAQRSVLAMVRGLLKHDRVTLRNLVNQAFRANAGVRVAPVNWVDVPMRTKVRFAYLRLETAVHTLRPTHGHGSQWTPIDNQLLFLSRCSLEYIRCWSELIMQKDLNIFGPGGAIYATVQHLPHLPTHEEVQEAVHNSRHTEEMENGDAQAQ
ncbi:hypothetical protein PCASD_17795 [Puccinia coronata f. sp. avenae]|uniref:Uncharacterized protein n=1 Tax=Puccinia coronata f. sp. avenae TaxID=200324 RepID=A0A2N5TBL6_9BASI|nr:hypothetical protein PCASD_17795 [Puccinia coronata f. sp. avenae]